MEFKICGGISWIGCISLFYYVFFITGVTGEEKLTCSPGLNTSGITVPKGEIALLYGQPLDLYCILDTEHEYYKDQGYNSSHLRFLRGMDQVEGKYVKIINSTTVHLHIPKPSLSNSIYLCKIEREVGSSAVCLNNVVVGTEPQPVEDLDCMAMNWEKLTCTWTAPHNYLKTNYSLYFTLPRRRYMPYRCPDYTVKGDIYTCVWTMSSSPHYRQSYPSYYIYLNSTNKFGSISQDLSFSHYAKLKSGSPVNLTLVNKTYNSCMFKWSIPISMQNFPPGVNHSIKYRTEFEDVWYTVNTSGLPLFAFNYTFNLTNLPYAFQLYNIRVAIRSEKASLDKYWSDYSYVMCKTQAKPPDRPPIMDIGSFEVATRETNRTITVYWEQLEIQEKNGENLTYKIEVLCEGVRLKSLTRHSNKGYAIVPSLPLKTLQFLISSVNEEGESPTKSSIIVPPQHELLDEPSYFTKIPLGNGTYELTWKAPKVNSSLLESYTVFWCDNHQDRPFQCQGRLHWKRIPANLTTKNFTVPDDNIYKFAISANGFETSSGMVWASCTVMPNTPVGKIKDVWYQGVQSTSVQIKWRLECPYNVGDILGYIIYYCRIHDLQNNTCKENRTAITVTQNDNNLGILTNLKPYSTYSVNVSIKAKHEVGEMSDPINFTTSEAAPDPPSNVSISELSSTKMIVSWQPPLNINGVLLYYVVYYTYDNLRNESKVEKNAPTLVELTGLLSYTNYSVVVKACTNACSNSSEELVVRTAIGSPGPVDRPNVDNHQTPQRIYWDPPRYPGGTVDLYEIKRVIVRQDSNESEIFNTTDTFLEIYDRACQEEGILGYLYSVRAVNYDSAEDHGAAAFTHMHRVKIRQRPVSGYHRDVYSGPWSTHYQNTCARYIKSDFIYWIIFVVIGIFLIIFMGLGIKKAWIKVVKMRTINAVMPDGLSPELDINSKLNLNLSPKHGKEHDVQYSNAPADEVSLLGSPSVTATSPGGIPTFITSTGNSSRRTNSPAKPYLAPYSAVGACSTDESDAEVPPQPVDNSYVSFASEPPSAPVSGGYVQASVLPSVLKEHSPNSVDTCLPSSDVLAAPENTSDLTEFTQNNSLPSSYVRSAPEPTSMPRIAVVSPYVTVDNVRFNHQTAPHQPEVNALKEPKSGYVTHNHSMFSNGNKTELPVLEHSTLPKRVSAPPLLSAKLTNDSTKRTSLNMNDCYTTVGLDSPEYCRFGWNSPETTGTDQHMRELQPEDCTPSINIANLGKEDYELPLDELLSDETTSISSIPATASHYLPLSQHSLKS